MATKAQSVDLLIFNRQTCQCSPFSFHWHKLQRSLPEGEFIRCRWSWSSAETSASSTGWPSYPVWPVSMTLHWDSCLARGAGPRRQHSRYSARLLRDKPTNLPKVFSRRWQNFWQTAHCENGQTAGMFVFVVLLSAFIYQPLSLSSFSLFHFLHLLKSEKICCNFAQFNLA